MKFYRVYLKEREERLRLANEHQKLYDELLRTSYSDFKLNPKIELKRTQSIFTEEDKTPKIQRLKFDAINDDEEELKIKVKMNMMKQNMHIFTPVDVQLLEIQ